MNQFSKVKNSYKSTNIPHSSWFYFNFRPACIAAGAKHRWRASKAGVQSLANFLRSFNASGDGYKRISNYRLLFTFVNEMMCARYAPSTSQARAVINYLEFLALTLAWRKKAAFRCERSLCAFCIRNLYTWPLTIISPADWWCCSPGPFCFWESENSGTLWVFRVRH